MKKLFRTPALIGAAAAMLLAWAPPSDARVTKIIIDRPATPLAGDATYETITGRAFGELDPLGSHNSLITDIALAPRNANGMVEYIASFFIVKPVDMSQSSGLMWHDVPFAFLGARSEEHTSELQSLTNLVCRLLLEKKKNITHVVPPQQRVGEDTRRVEAAVQQLSGHRLSRARPESTLNLVHSLTAHIVNTQQRVAR